jgi:hypothetical protein
MCAPPWLSIRNAAVLSFVASLAVLAGGCGQSEQEQVRKVVENYIQAVDRRDFDGTCELLTAGYRRQLGGTAGCVRSQLAQFGPEDARVELQIASVGVHGLRGDAGLTLSREGGGPAPYTLLLVRNREDRWRIRGQQ